MKINKNIIYIYYIFLYLSLLVGYYFQEDFTGGFKMDLETHNMLIQNLFDKGIAFGLLNYDIYYVPHSPIFIIYIIYLKKIFIFEDIYRLINLHFSLLIPFIVGLSLKVKYNLKKGDIRYLLPSIFFLSPYFRAGSIWTDDNLFAIIFLCISVYFFTKYEKKKYNFNNIIYCTLFLAICCYFRPIYSIFSIYFFINFFFNLRLSKKLAYYILLNLLLSFPAFYYLYILNINKWAMSYLFRENIFTLVALASSVIMFYFSPFILKDYKLVIKKLSNINSIIFYFFILILIFIFFEYNRTYSGGIVLKFSYLVFSNYYFFFFASSLCIVLLYILFFSEKKKIIFSDIIVITILFLIEIDGVIYHETYDPLIFILIFLIIKNTYISSFIKNLNLKKFLILFSFSSGFYLISILKILIFVN